MRGKDLNAQTLVNLGTMWQSIMEAKSHHGIGPGDTSARNMINNSAGFRKTVQREANKCQRGFRRMETILNRT